MNVKYLMPFPDHHAYSLTDLEQILRERNKHESALLVTTEKDAVRLHPLVNEAGSMLHDCYYCEVELRICEGEELIERELDRLVA